MKKTTVKIIPAVKARPEKKKEIIKTICDFCDAEVPDNGRYSWSPGCSLCARDTCREHNYPDPDDYGDYPSWFCKICYELRFNIYEGQYYEIIRKYEKEKEEFIKMIKEKSLESPIPRH